MRLARYRERTRSTAETIGQRIRAARKAAGLTLEQLAELVDSHRPIVGRIEHGRCTPKIATLELYAAALGVDVVELLEGAA